jgi:hypothetical protein
MKKPQKIPSTMKWLAVGVAILSCVSSVLATPYATSLTNNAGVVSFRLNQTTGTNDTVQVISSGGTVTNILQSPATSGTNVLTRGLIVTNLGVAAGTVKIEIKHTGSGVISSNTPLLSLADANIRGIVANRNPASPYFGWVYYSTGSSTGAVAGLYALTPDFFDILGQGSVGRTGGYPLNTSGFEPYKLSIDPTNDMVLMADASANTGGNLIELPPTLTNFSYVLKAFNGTIPPAGGPVGTNNNHGEVAGSFLVGTGTNRVLYTMDESYQTDPTSTTPNEWNSVWKYSIGTNSLPYTNAPDAKVMTPYLFNFQGQNEGIQVGTNGYLYANQRRSNPPQFSIYICDLSNLVNPATYFGGQGGYFWDSQTESLAEGYSDDVTRDVIQIATSSDGNWLAGLVAAGSGNITAPDGSTFANAANDIILLPLTNGIPNLAGRQVFHVGGAANGRDIAFDAANNLYIGSSGLGAIQAFDIGETTDATTGSDGTFSVVKPSIQVTAAATTPVAFQAGAVPGVVTFTRTGDESLPLTVFFTFSGTAKYGTNANGGFIVTTNATTTTNSVTIPANQASASVSVVPTPANTPQPSLTAILTIKGSGGYSIGFPASAIVSIADNHTPQLQVSAISTNIFQGTTNDYAKLTLTRLGDTNITLMLTASDFAFGGTAVLGTDFYLANLPLTIPAGVISQSVNLIFPGTHGSTSVGQLSIILTNLADAGYSVSNNFTNTTLTLQAVPTETVLFSDDFETDTTGTNWTLTFGTYNSANMDYTVNYSYDYTSGSIGNLAGVPPAPHSTNGDTHGLYMTVNKSAGVSSGLNLYLKNKNFSGNYAVRFDMFLVRNSAGTAQSQAENVIFGINHDGAHTNWFRNQVPGTDVPGNPTASDGIWFDVGTDGNGGGGANDDFGCWSSPTYTNTSGVIGPTNFLSRLATTTRQVFKNPPFNGGTSFGGDPANTILTTTPTWSQVEVSQVGPLITWKINNTVIFLFTNTPADGLATTYSSGTVMLGYVDPWDDLGNSSAGSGEGCAIIDNLKVVQLSTPVIASQPTNFISGVGSNATFSVAVASTSTGVTNYQWFFNGVAISNATSPTLSFTTTPTNYGSYNVSVSDGTYTIYSAVATLLPPTNFSITTQPTDQIAALGGAAKFTVAAITYSGQTNYQWYFNNAVIASGGTSATLSLANLAATNFGPGYFVAVNDGFNAAITSSVAHLIMASSPSITTTTSGTNLVLAFPTQIGPSYVVQFKTNLLSATWTSLVTNNGTGGTILVTNSLFASPDRFFRILLK